MNGADGTNVEDVWDAAEGLILHPINRWNQIQSRQLTDHAVAVIIKQVAERAVSDPAAFSGHSLLADLAIAPAAAGVGQGDRTTSHGAIGGDVCIAIEIEAEIPGSVPDPVIRIVTENSRTLKFKSSGFEETPWLRGGTGNRIG